MVKPGYLVLDFRGDLLCGIISAGSEKQTAAQCGIGLAVSGFRFHNVEKKAADPGGNGKAGVFKH